MNTLELKSILLKQCSQFVANRSEKILKTIKDIEYSLKEESKSTSGDKHHTGRAILQIDREHVGYQLKEIEKVKDQLQRVDISSTSEVVRLGSVVRTNQALFFISISVGKLEVNKTSYIGIAPNSPIGLCLLGKKVGDQFNFNGKIYKILNLE